MCSEELAGYKTVIRSSISMYLLHCLYYPLSFTVAEKGTFFYFVKS